MNSLPDLSGFTDKKILIVDDNDINIMLNKIFLKNAGINKENIFIAIDGFEALELAQQELFDVIVMDIHMP
jgi:CheY-like chemotaxis protein